MDALSWEETAPLGEALSHPSPAVRLAALRALVRLPLEPAIWLELSAYVVNLLEQVPEGEDLEHQTLNGLPLGEVLESAAYIPTRKSREGLYRFLNADEPAVRAAAARALVRARDPAAVEPMAAELLRSDHPHSEIAETLSLLDVSQHVQVVRSAFQAARDDDTAFWLAITLARGGEPNPLELVLAGIARGEVDLRAAWGDPEIFLAKLGARGPFPPSIRDVLKEIVDNPYASPQIREICAALVNAGVSVEMQADQEQELEPVPENPELESLAEEVTAAFAAQGELGDELSERALRPELLPYLPPHLAGKLVTALFITEVQKDTSAGGNWIVQAVYENPGRFEPDLLGLFQAYRLAAQDKPGEWTSAVSWELRWQIAWTASLAGLRQILVEYAGLLRSDSEPERVLTARLIEDVARSIYQEFPPMFGGGGAPPEPDVFPVSELLEDQLTGELKSANGGEGGAVSEEPGPPPEDVETGSTPPWILEDLEFEEKAEELGVPRTRGLDRQREVHVGGSEPPGERDTRGIDPRFSFDPGGFGFAGDEEESDDGPGDPGPGGEEVLEGLQPGVPEARERTVNTGFCPVEDPDDDLQKEMPLRAGGKYYFWLSIGPRDIASVETGPSPEVRVPLEARITVAVFGFEDGLVINPAADIGELRERGGRVMEPVKQPLGEKAPQTEKKEERLYFPIQAPAQPGEYRMRCNLYWGQVLLQSRLVEALVEAHPTPRNEDEPALKVTADYTIAPSLNPAHLRQLPEHRLSVLMNQNADGTHSFHFLGAQNGKVHKNDDIRFGENELQDMITTARKKLRRVSWGTEEEWDREHDSYLYEDRQVRLDRLKADLFNLAQWGYAFYDQLSQRIAGKGIDEYELQDLMTKPGIVQIALKESPSYILPVAMIYDYDLAVGAPDLSLCKTFEQALTSSQALETVACFQGECPSRGDLKVVCPSGFWGFRHYLGTPLTVVDSQDVEAAAGQNGAAFDIPPTIEVRGDLRVAAGVATNLDFTTSHIDKIRQLRDGTVLDYADTRERVFEVLKGNPHLVYFYCHGGYAGSAPYLQVGEDATQIIDPSNIKAYRIRWKTPRPLVFINGCHTTSVAPLQALQFISPFVTRARCAGVIGTEITIFEELATAFAEACLARFYTGDSIGMAMRNARLALLQEGNPLGLVYIPFVMAGLRLVEKA